MVLERGESRQPIPLDVLCYHTCLHKTENRQIKDFDKNRKTRKELFQQILHFTGKLIGFSDSPAIDWLKLK